jgi:hypothetical protein
MRNTLAAAVLIVASGSALADGNGAATSDITFGPNNPNCYMWRTNGGSLVYGVPFDAIGKVFATISQIRASQGGLCALTFDQTNTYAECSGGGVISVNKVECK